MAFKPFEKSMNSLKGPSNPFQVDCPRGGPRTIYQDSEGFIYVGGYVADPAKVTLRECIEVLTNKATAERPMTVLTLSGAQMDPSCLDKTIAELLTDSRGYTVLLDGSMGFFYRHVLTPEQAQLSNDEQFELYEAYKAEFQ